MSELYLECYSGISGDMTVGALLDLGADKEALLKVLATVPAKGFAVRISSVVKSGIEACDFDVILDAEHENHDHDMQYLYGESEAAEHTHAHGHHHHEHRSLQDVYAVIDGTQMSEEARTLARRIFRIVAEAESKVHGKPLEEVHFHEVGAVDSIVDIIAIAVCFDDLRKKENITDVIVPVLYEGCGTVRCQHGVLPVPVPAVTAIAESHGLSLHLLPDSGEFVTPTGAAAAAALSTKKELPEKFVIVRTGLGAGKRDYRRAGVVRAMLLEEQN